jgi:hypothetical protein
LVKQYHDGNCQDKTIIAKIQKAITSSPDLRDKKELIMNFIEKMTPNPGVSQDEEDDVVKDWNKFVEQERDAELSNIIREEGLKPKETRSFINQSIADGYVASSGVAITKVMPPMPIFGKGAENRENKKRRILEKLTAFFNKYFNLSSAPMSLETLHPLVLKNVEDDQEVRNRIFDRLHIDPDTTVAELQKEVLEEYGMRYPDMTINEWRHLIEDYTPMVKDAIKSRDEKAKTIPLSFDKAAEDLDFE